MSPDFPTFPEWVESRLTEGTLVDALQDYEDFLKTFGHLIPPERHSVCNDSYRLGLRAALKDVPAATAPLRTFSPGGYLPTPSEEYTLYGDDRPIATYRVPEQPPDTSWLTTELLGASRRRQAAHRALEDAQNAIVCGPDDPRLGPVVRVSNLTPIIVLEDPEDILAWGVKRPDLQRRLIARAGSDWEEFEVFSMAGKRLARYTRRFGWNWAVQEPIIQKQAPLWTNYQAPVGHVSRNKPHWRLRWVTYFSIMVANVVFVTWLSTKDSRAGLVIGAILIVLLVPWGAQLLNDWLGRRKEDSEHRPEPPAGGPVPPGVVQDL